MKNKDFHTLLTQITKLTYSQSQQVQNHLHHQNSVNSIEDVIGKVTSCPHCHSDKLQQWGFRSGLQRYRCTTCHRTFNALSKTSLARLRHKEVWLDYAQELINGHSIRASATHCHVDKTTTFRWRHKMLQIPSLLKDKHLHGIVEFDETYFLSSRKGERHLDRKPRHRGGRASRRGISPEQTAVLIVRDRSGKMTDSILQKSNQHTLADVMVAILDPDVLLCSDKKPSYEAFARNHHFVLKTINVSQKQHVKQGIYHIQHVNAYDSRLKSWMKHFHGVATKYLDHYLGWLRLLDKEKFITTKQLLAIIGRQLEFSQPLTHT